jgi:hypothetical protein
VPAKLRKPVSDPTRAHRIDQQSDGYAATGRTGQRRCHAPSHGIAPELVHLHADFTFGVIALAHETADVVVAAVKKLEPRGLGELQPAAGRNFEQLPGTLGRTGLEGPAAWRPEQRWPDTNRQSTIAVAHGCSFGIGRKPSGNRA